MMTCHLSIRPAITCTVPCTQLLAASRRHMAASYWTAASDVAPTSALEITPDLATRATTTPLSFLKEPGCPPAIRHYQISIDYEAVGRLRKLRPEEAWETIEDLAQHEEEKWNDPIFSKKGSPDYMNATLK
nr:zinc finger, CCHC-type [Tanacetum cinerariifolium]